jgi:hypothetical protein
MKDRIVTLLCLLAILLSFGVVVSWARSMMNCEGVSVYHGYCRYILQANQGVFRYSRMELAFDSSGARDEYVALTDPDHTRDRTSWNVSWSRDMIILAGIDNSLLGFGAESEVVDPPPRRFSIPGMTWKRTVVQIPHWFVIVLIGGLPTWWLMRRSKMHQARARQGLCRRCGFELGTLYHSCPKCGERAPLPEGFPVIQSH